MAANSVQGKVVIVTGSGGGLGKAIAKAYLAAGAKVTISDVNSDRLAAVSAEWKAEHEDSLLAVKTDVTDEASLASLVSETVSRFGRLDVLVNNAGIMDRFEPVATCQRSTWDAVLAVNLTGTFLATRAAVGQFVAQGEQQRTAEPGTGEGTGDTGGDTGGIIINISSNAGIRGMSAGVAYTASKHGVIALTRSTAGFYGDKGIYAVALVLGAMLSTNITDAFAHGLDMESLAKVNASQPPLRPETDGIDIDDVARYCVFLGDRKIAAGTNGSCVTFNKNWPPA